MLELERVVVLLALFAFGNTTPIEPVYDTIIVGMGAAGCSAASVLCQAGKRVLALEAQDRVGGRVNTVAFGNSTVELGAEWIHGERPSPVYDLAMKNNISILSQNLGYKALRSDGTDLNKDVLTELIMVADNFTKLSPEQPQPLGQFITKEITEYITNKHPSLLEDKDFMKQLFHMLEVLTDSYEGSYSWNDVSTFSNSVDPEGDMHLSWHEHGYKTLFEILLNKYKGGPGYPTLDLKLQKVVTKISYPSDPSQLVEVSCEDGSVYKARNVIVTVSLGVLKESHTTLFSPALPATKVTAIENISMGLIAKVVLLFPNPWWETITEGEIYFFWTKEDREALKEDWTVTVVGASVPMSNKNALTLWTYGDAAKLMESLPEDVVKDKSMALLRRFVGNTTTIPDPTDILRTTWFSNPFTRGTYTYDNLKISQRPNIRDDLSAPIVDSSGVPRVLFSGEATNSIHYGTVNGAVETGLREGTRLLNKVTT